MKKGFYETRAASHAGSWYSENRKALTQQLNVFLGSLQPISNLKAIIAPHAGYDYSGATAGEAYKHLDKTKIKRIFLFGPSHHYYLEECALSKAKQYQTPLGNINIDQKLNDEIFQSIPDLFSTMTKSQDEKEHSLEMHLPFIYTLMEGSDFLLVPVLVGNLSLEKEFVYGKFFSNYLKQDGNFFIISSDFCHWGDRFDYTYYDSSQGKIYESIEALDKEGMSLIATKDLTKFNEYLLKKQNSICGRHPIGILLAALEALEAESPTASKYSISWIAYAQSSQVHDISDSSVSYAVALCTQTVS